MLKAIIVDDESNQRENLRMILEGHCSGIEVVAEGKSALEGAGLIMKHNPDVIFLDVEMPGGTGLDLLQSLENVDAKVILVTAHANHMQEAFKVNVFDYIIKPIDIEEMIDTVDRIVSSTEVLTTESVKVALPSSNGLTFVNKEEILFIKAQGSYSEVQLKSGKSLLISKNLKFFESIITDKAFLRIHRSCIINLFHVAEFSKSDGGLVILSNGMEFPVGKDQRDVLLSALEGF
ncbi:MAG: two-component system LytT family response regulator [Crocinitomicaceae bacterium]|jgi:two-component system LytT family response regulator